MTLRELAERLECRLEGDGSIEVSRVVGLDEAGPGDLSFLANPKYASRLAATRAGAIIAGDEASHVPCPVLRTRNPYLAFARAVAILTPPQRPAPGISPLASVDGSATLGADVSVGPFACIGPGASVGARTIVEPHVVVGASVLVGADSHLHSHVVLRERVRLGDRVVVQHGTVIGSDGFGFAHTADGTHVKIPQVGGVVIEDDVEIGALCAVDRPAVGETRIGEGTKIDNLVQVAHGVKIGRRVLLAAQVGIAGSTVLGDGVIMAGQSGATGHVHLGNAAVVGAKSAVTKDVPDGQHVTGIPATSVADWRESVVLVRRLPELRRAVADLEARLAALESRLK